MRLWQKVLVGVAALIVCTAAVNEAIRGVHYATGNLGTLGTPNEGVRGVGAHGWGVVGQTYAGSRAAVLGESSHADSPGVYGVNIWAGSGTGVKAEGFNGLLATTTSEYGNGVKAEAPAIPYAYALWALATDPAKAGVFSGNVSVMGTLTKTAGSFRIDHPLAPAEKYLSHSFVESPDMKNIYDGVVELGPNGSAVVELPAYFEALNADFRYQLTCIGRHADVYIAEEIAGNRFTIDGGYAGLKVSWQVTGIRKDAYAAAHRIVVEEDKPLGERGTFLHPIEHGAPSNASVDHQRIERARRPR